MPYASGRKPDAIDRLASDVRRLSRLLTRDRDRLAADYLRDPALRRAYREYFLPVNLPKVQVPLAELARHPAGVLRKDRLRVLDIGTGPGTSVLGVMAFFAQRATRPSLAFTAIDGVQENLREAEALFGGHADRYGGNASLQTIQCVVEDAASRLQGRFDLIVISNVLNELFARASDGIDRRVRLVAGILRDLLEDAGSCIMIEPALRETARDLLQVRDGLVGPACIVYAPCLIQAPCPALAGRKDWCHEDRPWNPPGRVGEIDARAGLRKDSLKFSYLVLRKDGKSLADSAGRGAHRIVSDPLVSRGKREYYVCGTEGRRLIVRLDKDATSRNEAFGGLVRGDIVRFDGLLDEARRFRVAKETVVVPEGVLPDAGPPITP